MKAKASFQKKSEKYKGVWLVNVGTGKDHWRMYTSKNGRNISGYYKTEREAAIAYDKVLIEKGKEPVNILKRR